MGNIFCKKEINQISTPKKYTKKTYQKKDIDKEKYYYIMLYLWENYLQKFFNYFQNLY